MLPAPEQTDPAITAEPVAVVAEPADGVVEAMALIWED